jgi:hypothetical protein
MYPDDEQFGATAQLTSPIEDPSRDPLKPIGPTRTPDIINYRPPASPGAVLSREDELAGLPPSILASLGQVNSGIVVAPDSASRQRDEYFRLYGTALPQGVHESYQQHTAALADADKYLAVSKHFHDMQQEAKSKLDSADFLREAASLDHTDPNYDARLGALFAKYPHANGSIVQDAVTSKHQARANYLQGTAPGGAEEFGVNTPERQAYINRLGQTKDPRAARAHAQNVQKGEEMIKTAVAKGLINLDTDFPSWDGEDASKPAVYNDDGSVNYHQVALLAASRAPDAPGGVNDKADTADMRELKTWQSIINQASKDETWLENPTNKATYDLAISKLHDYHAKQGPAKTAGRYLDF